MKRTLLAALVLGAAYLFLPSKAEGQVFSIFSNVTTNADTTNTKPTGLYNGIASCGLRCDVRIWCDTGTCAAIVTAYCRIDASDSEPWYPCASVTNPTANGNYITLANSRQYKFAIESWSSGGVHLKYFSLSQ